LYRVAITTDSRVSNDAWSTEFAGMMDKTGEWKVAVNGYLGEVKLAFQEWETQMETISEETIGKDLEELKNKTDDITKASEELKDALTKKDGVIDTLGSEADAVAAVTEKYAAQRTEIEGLIGVYETLLNSINATIRAQSGVDDTSDDSDTSTNSTDTSDTSGTSDSSQTATDSSGTGGTYTVKSGDSLSAIAAALGYPGGWRALYEKNKSVVGSNANLIYPGQVLQLKSGGYTGAWGSYGKMAMLHEKELVLNAGDTENFLASLEFLHKILEIIDLQTMSSQLGGILSSPGMYNNNMNTVEQNVHIEASFPNAVNHSEIEEAFNNLINTSSQFANKK
jgi:LysM repeat protein